MTEIAPPPVQPQIYVKTGIDPYDLDEDAVRVVSRLRRKGHDGFLVGGCVRDLLLGCKPKDFDVATSARPRQIKSLFRNCRIIGRRFKLAHLHFNSKILEVSTFRRPPEEERDEEDLLIRSDNAFGTADEDAHRRDFTINALFFDPETDCIHDYVGGIEDIRRGVVRTIGDPLTRIKEDPVRILRAVKFAARLHLQIDPETWRAMCEAAGDLSKSATPRLLEELLRLVRSGAALQAFQLLRDCGALRVLMPEVAGYLDNADRDERIRFWRMLEAIDTRVRAEDPGVTPAVAVGALLYRLLERSASTAVADFGHEPDLGRLAEEMLGPILRRINFSRADSGRLKRIAVVQRRFHGGEARRNFKVSSFQRQDYYAEAMALLRLRCLADGEDWEAYDEWLRQPPAPDRPAPAQARPRPRPAEPRHEQQPERRNGEPGRDRASGRGRAEDGESRGRRGRRRRGRRGRQGDGRSDRDDQQRTPLPPLPDVELDPSEVPTYGSILGDTGSAEKIEREQSRSRKQLQKLAEADAPYTPPPPPKSDTKRGGDDDTFGDW